jgi:hypothetical protein
VANRKVDPLAVERALARRRNGESRASAAAAEGISAATLKSRELALVAPEKPPTPPPLPAAGDLPPFDIEGKTPLEIARAMIARTSIELQNMPADSPRRNPAAGQLRAWTKMLADLEREAVAKESPEEAQRRLRREDKETLKMILWSVEKAEKEAAARGVCIHCQQPLPK